MACQNLLLAPGWGLSWCPAATEFRGWINCRTSLLCISFSLEPEYCRGLLPLKSQRKAQSNQIPSCFAACVPRIRKLKKNKKKKIAAASWTSLPTSITSQLGPSEHRPRWPEFCLALCCVRESCRPAEGTLQGDFAECWVPVPGGSA